MKSKLILFTVLSAFLFFACNDSNEKEKNDEKAKDNSQTEETATDKEEEKDVIETFVSQDYGFSVDFLKVPIQQEEEVPTMAGTLKMMTFMHDAGSQVYFVAISKMPEELMADADVDDMLEGGIDGMLEQFSDVEILQREKITSGDIPGRIIEATGTTSGTEVYNKAHIFMKDNSLYQVYVLAEASKADKDKINAFINSFSFLEDDKK
jgi:hypothetical protein